MAKKHIRCCILGAREKDLFALGEIHKRRDVEIAFVYDRVRTAVGIEIAEILGIDRLHSMAELSKAGGVDYAVVSEPRATFEAELEMLRGAGAKILSQTEALKVLCNVDPSEQGEARPSDEPYSLEDALEAFERLFDRKQVLKFLLDVSVEATGATAGSIMMYSEEANELYIANAIGLSERVIRNTRQKLGEGVAGRVAQTRIGELLLQPPSEGQYADDRDRLDIRSAISVPLTLGERLLGVLNVSTNDASKPLTEDGLRSLERLSTRISRVLHESIKLQETQVRHQEMNLRQSMGELTEKSISPAAKFSVISNLLGELVGADTVEVFVSTHEGDWLMLGGSNRRLSRQPEMIRCEKGALARSYLERRTIVLTESADDEEGFASSIAYVPLHMGDETLGVLLLEFGERHRLDDFLVIKDSVTLELSRFISSERREGRLRREVTALGKVSDAAPALLTCRTTDDLCEYIARVVADTLECERVSVRIQPPDGSTGKVARFENANVRSQTWIAEDEERFLKLRKTGEAFNLAFLNFAPEAGDRSPAYHSLVAVPIEVENAVVGGIIAYDKRPVNTLDGATFSDLDQMILEHIIALAVPVVRGLSRSRALEPTEAPSYDDVLSGNIKRLRKLMTTEMSRADRYHNAFSVVMLRIQPLEALFEEDFERALMLVDEITRGIQTRTRKTDFGSWVRRDTFAMLSLEGTKRIKFLVSRLMLYLLKDFTQIGSMAIEPADVLVGTAIYPGASKTPEALLSEVEGNLKPYSQG